MAKPAPVPAETATVCPTLTEAERRRVWNGYCENLEEEEPHASNLIRAGRTFLRSIGQEPRWSKPGEG